MIPRPLGSAVAREGPAVALAAAGLTPASYGKSGSGRKGAVGVKLQAPGASHTPISQPWG